MTPELKSKLEKVLALTTSPVEGEAAAAAAMLKKLLSQHNLDIADLEKRGSVKPQIGKQQHDLGKAAFTWKLDLAEVMAKHFFCEAIIDRRSKSVHFIGRPDNVESMQMLYGWLIQQIKQICSNRRVEHQTATGEHVDPLRWQVNFGLGVVSRMGDRFTELRKRQQDEASETTALVVSHATEISDWLEEHYGYRMDGRKTKRQVQNDAWWAKESAEAAALKVTDIEAYYAKFPWERPVVETEKQKQARLKREAKNWEKQQARWAREDEKEERREANLSPEELRKRQQAEDAKSAGRASAKDVNLEPFLGDKATAADTLGH